MREIGGVPLAEMQMITGSYAADHALGLHGALQSRRLHAAAAHRRGPANIDVAAVALDGGHDVVAGQPARMFGTTAPGTFKITNYNNGYFWGIGVGPQGSTVGNFTVARLDDARRQRAVQHA